MSKEKKPRKIKVWWLLGGLVTLMPMGMIMLLVMFFAFLFMGSGSPEAVSDMYEIPHKALRDAVRIYEDTDLHWLSLLASYASEYGCQWEEYKEKYLKNVADVIKDRRKGNRNYGINDYVQEYVVSQEDYAFYCKNYDRIYGILVNKFHEYDEKYTKICYYYPSYFPIPKNYGIRYSDDFMEERQFEDIFFHDGIDILCKEGTPIIAVESGIIETVGWNAAGGWRVGVRSGDRFWYYAHMRKVHPYYGTLGKGDRVSGGQVIGYVGSTGYSHAVLEDTMPDAVTRTHPDADDTQMPAHLHIGLKVKMVVGENPDDYVEQWVNPYPILKFLENNKAEVKKETVTKIIDGKEAKEETGEYVSIYKSRVDRVFGRYEAKK